MNTTFLGKKIKHPPFNLERAKECSHTCLFYWSKRDYDRQLSTGLLQLALFLWLWPS